MSPFPTKEVLDMMSPFPTIHRDQLAAVVGGAPGYSPGESPQDDKDVADNKRNVAKWMTNFGARVVTFNLWHPFKDNPGQQHEEIRNRFQQRNGYSLGMW
jgi:hypothetical protein